MNMRPLTTLPSIPILAGVAQLLLLQGGLAQQAVTPPPNDPATVAWDATRGRLSLRYHGSLIFDGMIRAEDAAGKAVAGAEVKFEPAETRDQKEKVEQRLKFSLAKPQEGVKLVLGGTATGSGEAFAAETESEAQQRFPVLRTSVGPSRSLRNNAVYDRRWDWMLAGPADGAIRIAPSRSAGVPPASAANEPPGRAPESNVAFAIECRGPSIELVFRPRFYQKHKGIGWFEPWTYQIWKDSVTGYCSWWPYRGGFDHKALDAVTAAFTTHKLPDFGYRYVQIDDCFQTGGGSPRGFLEWNDRFPGGAAEYVCKVRAAGMEPGIWVFCIFYDSDPLVRQMVKDHPEWFVLAPDGKPRRAVNPWTGAGFYALDPTNEEALDRLVRPTYRGAKDLGFTYVKIDGAGDLVDWGYRPAGDYFKDKGITPGGAMRRFYQTARAELGRDTYILTCWGVLPEQIGVADACRVSTDGFRAASFQGFSSWEGVVWRNDPDHCDVLPESKVPQGAMRTFGAAAVPPSTIIRPGVIAMAGGVLLLSDKAEVYSDPANLEGAKRSSPVLFTVPGQLHDYTPRAPDWSFEKSFRDYGQKGGGEAEWWLQEIDRPFDHWSVLARFQWGEGSDINPRPMHGMPERKVEFADLGLEPGRDYLVFEFWTQIFLGKCRGSFTAPAMDTNNGMQVFAIREARAYPWVLSTTRHLSQGGVCLMDEKWDQSSNILSGTSKVIAGDPYVLTVHLPAGFKLKAAAVAGEKVEIANQQETATVRIVPSATRTVAWEMTFTQ